MTVIENVDFELALGLIMYREQITDINTHSDEWPKGMESNLGEIDLQAEMCIRKIWGELPREKQAQLLARAAEAVRDRANG